MIEKLSRFIHGLWCSWAKSIIEEEALSKDRLDRWKKCFVSYDKLPEEEKKKDRIIAVKILNIITKKEGK